MHLHLVETKSHLAVANTLTNGMQFQNTYFLAVAKHVHSAFTDPLIPDNNQDIAYTNTRIPCGNLNTHFTVTNGLTHGSNAFTIGSNQHSYTWL